MVLVEVVVVEAVEKKKREVKGNVPKTSPDGPLPTYSGTGAAFGTSKIAGSSCRFIHKYYKYLHNMEKVDFSKAL